MTGQGLARLPSRETLSSTPPRQAGSLQASSGHRAWSFLVWNASSLLGAPLGLGAGEGPRPRPSRLSSCKPGAPPRWLPGGPARSSIEADTLPLHGSAASHAERPGPGPAPGTERAVLGLGVQQRQTDKILDGARMTSFQGRECDDSQIHKLVSRRVSDRERDQQEDRGRCRDSNQGLGVGRTQ